MSTHVHGLTVAMLADAARAARIVDHSVTLVDDYTHTVVVVTMAGAVITRPEETR